MAQKPSITGAIALGRSTDARDVGMPWRDVAGLLEAAKVALEYADSDPDDALAALQMIRGTLRLAIDKATP